MGRRPGDQPGYRPAFMKGQLPYKDRSMEQVASQAPAEVGGRGTGGQDIVLRNDDNEYEDDSEDNHSGNNHEE